MVTNNGTISVPISIGLIGADPGDFGQTNNCPGTLNPSSSCQINVTFTPTTSGSRPANVDVTITSNHHKYLAGLSGTGAQSVTVDLLGNTAPATVDSADANSAELGMIFNTNASGGQITGCRFYKASTNTGTHVCNLWTTAGVNLARVTVTGETTSGWQQMNFPSPVVISPNTNYVISYFAPSGHYSNTTSSFTSAVTFGPLTAPASGSVSPGNGVFLYSGATAFPTGTFNATNYSVDVLYNYTPPPQTPTVIAFNPGSPVTVFDNAITSQTIANVNVTTSDGNAFPNSDLSLTVNAGGRVALVNNTIVPAHNFTSSDDGNGLIVTVQASENGTSISQSLTLNVAVDPTARLLPPASDGYANWSIAGFNAVPLTASIDTGGTLTATFSPSAALGVGQTIKWAGGGSATIVAAKNDPSANALTGTGGIGTYTVSPAPGSVVASQAMIASGIPNRCATNNASCVHATVSPSGGDDTAAINAAIQGCAAGKVVRLAAGVFHVTFPSINFNNQGAYSCTLRGAGPGQLLELGLNLLDGSLFTASTSGTTMTVSATTSANTAVIPGMVVNGTSVPVGTTVTNQLTQTGPNIGSAGTYTISCPGGCPGSISSEAMSGTTRLCTSGSLATVSGNWGSYCTDPTATQMIFNNLSQSFPIITQAPANRSFVTSYNLASDAVQGSQTINLSNAPTGINPGDMVWLDETNETNPLVVWGSNGPFCGSGYGARFCDRTVAQLAEVQSVSGNTVSLDTPITYPFHTAYSAQLTTMQQTFLRGLGIENLFLWGGQDGNIQFTQCSYCWVKNVDSSWERGEGIQATESFRFVLRDSATHEAVQPTPGGGGYLMSLQGGTSESLAENNISWIGNKQIVMRMSGGGNVVAYNFMADSMDDGSSVAGVEAGVNAGHFTTPHLELIEGNESQNFKGDSFWGGSLYITAFRNNLTGLRYSSFGSPSPWASKLPLGGYEFQWNTNSGNCYPYADFSSDRGAVDIQGHSFGNNVVGNVLGFNGQVPLVNTGSCFTFTSAPFVETVTTPTQWGAQDGNGPFMIRAGVIAIPGQWSFDPTAISTLTITGNWSWNSRSMHCYAFGTVTDQSCSGVTIPNSFYLTSKPAFFGTSQWPWVDPTTGTTYTLPAKYCFEHNQMPNCLQ